MKSTHLVSKIPVSFLLLFLLTFSSCRHEQDEISPSTGFDESETSSRLSVMVYPNGDTHEYFYDENGNVNSEVVKSGGVVQGVFKNFECQNGKVLYKEYFEQDIRKYFVQYSYESELLVLISRFSVNGSELIGQSKQEYEYTNGLLTSYVDSYKDPVSGIFKIQERHTDYQYYNDDNLKSYIIEMEMADGISEFCRVEFTYDKSGNRITETDIYTYQDYRTFEKNWTYDSHHRVTNEAVYLKDQSGNDRLVSYKENFQYDHCSNLLYYDDCSNGMCRAYQYIYEYF